MGLVGHAISFNMIVDGQETMIIPQNPHYMALVNEEMRLAMNNYFNQVWVNILNPLAPNMSNHHVHTMVKLWNLSQSLNHAMQQNQVMDLPFFPPE